MPQTGNQIITIYILPNISRSKSNQAVKFGELIEYFNRNIFFEKHAENESGRIVPDLFLSFFFKKLYINSKQVASALILTYFGRLPLRHTIKTKCITDCWSELSIRLLTQRYAHFLFFIKGSRPSFPTIFYVWFFKKNISVILTYHMSLSYLKASH